VTVAADELETTTPLEERPVVIRTVGLAKSFPRHTHGSGALGRALARAAGTVDVADEDDDEEDEDSPDDVHGDGTTVLRDVDLEVRAGRALGIVGPASSGKTTLLSILAGLSSPTAGHVELYAKPVPVFDSLPKLMQDGKAWRNVVLLARIMGMSRRWARQRVGEIFEFAGLTGSESRTRKTMPVADVQRLALATVLQLDGGAYLVDSTLGGRDRAFRDRCLALLDERRRAGAAVIYTSRELEDAQRVADEIAWLQDGKIAVRGTASTIASAIQVGRAQRHVRERVPRSREAEQFLGFLRLAIGELRTTDALHVAEESARSSGDGRVEWQELAAAAGYDIGEAHRVVDRLTRRADGTVPLVPVFDSHAAIAGGDAEETPEGVRLRVLVEVAAAPLELGCSIVLVGADDRYLRIDQPTRLSVGEPRLVTLDVLLPEGTLPEGSYRGTIFASIAVDGTTSMLFRRDLLRFRVGAGEGDDDELLLDAFDPTELSSAAGIDRLDDLEWHVDADPS
jgi:ABC-type polysaccharide/polyol phosphate transport system ATPase subunit